MATGSPGSPARTEPARSDDRPPLPLQLATEATDQTELDQRSGPPTREVAGTLARRAVLASHPSETQPPYRLAAYSVAALRLALGAAALAVPEQAGAIWVGSGGQERDRAVLLRSCGGRDVALGIGAVMSLRRRSDARLWLLMGALSDFGDAVSTAARFAELPRWRRWAVLVASLAASCTGALCALNLAPPEPRA